jgi:hypothetical protein
VDVNHQHKFSGQHNIKRNLSFANGRAFIKLRHLLQWTFSFSKCPASYFLSFPSYLTGICWVSSQGKNEKKQISLLCFIQSNALGVGCSLK